MTTPWSAARALNAQGCREPAMPTTSPAVVPVRFNDARGGAIVKYKEEKNGVAKPCDIGSELIFKAQGWVSLERDELGPTVSNPASLIKDATNEK